MNKTIRIATRESKLAVWQAHCVQQLLSETGIQSELIFIKSEGDVNLVTPLYELGVQGIFTRSLDIALIENKADIAVHSYKDVPTQPASGLSVGAVLKRGNHLDMLVTNKNKHTETPDLETLRIIATSSIRRKAQWLHRYPGTVIDNIRGNVNTRLQKLSEANWDAAIFAAAGLERLNLTPPETGIQQILDWMIPAPAQGAVAVVCRNNDAEVKSICEPLHDTETGLCTNAERNFLRFLQGGCSTPISAYAIIRNGKMTFTGNVTATDGTKSLDICFESDADDPTLAKRCADEMISQGFETIKLS